jgi:hypothetical protein
MFKVVVLLLEHSNDNFSPRNKSSSLKGKKKMAPKNPPPPPDPTHTFISTGENQNICDVCGETSSSPNHTILSDDGNASTGDSDLGRHGRSAITLEEAGLTSRRALVDEDKSTRDERFANLAARIETVGDENLRSILRDFLYSDLDDEENPNHPDFGKPKMEPEPFR